MRIFDVLFYNYYLLANRNQPVTNPAVTAILTLSFSESLLLNYSIDVLGAHLLCRFIIGKWGMILILVGVLFINYLIYIKGERAKVIVKNEPKFFDSIIISKYLTVAFIVITTSFLFWVADYAMHVIEQCQ
ncbi:MAG: hypothetical protein IM631_09640 [Cytophagales bacterium]|nr:hypothetical protein [Cytophagales bacterium]MCA6367295.1 hypothetical protein [Cytophagales bacterium]MCA6371652.1 hypothetical protein [Cytophagales bacterium]MCA6376219.1 hypothetical protein [Cytophagales bacterium]MCA6384040.1 hypothetical protein [Cytophagales bacterium]